MQLRQWLHHTHSHTYVYPYSTYIHTCMHKMHTDTHTHTCSEQSLRILMWNASYVQKHSNYTWQEWVSETTREGTEQFPSPMHDRLRKPYSQWSDIKWKSEGRSLVSVSFHLISPSPFGEFPSVRNIWIDVKLLPVDVDENCFISTLSTLTDVLFSWNFCVLSFWHL